MIGIAPPAEAGSKTCIRNNSSRYTVFVQYDSGSYGSIATGQRKCGIRAVYGGGHNYKFDVARVPGSDGYMSAWVWNRSYHCSTTNGWDPWVGGWFWVAFTCTRGY
ncbi:MAG: hypothetical protein AAGA17_08730 [Actinomycetota bacterium]